MENNRGKKKCDLLKSVRKRIADENGIPYEPTPCSFTGECKGTCPKCESEMRYLEKELSVRKRMGRSVKIVGLATGLVSLAACSSPAEPTNQSIENEDSGEIVEGEFNREEFEYDTVRVTTVVSCGDSTSFVVPSGDTEKGDPWNCHKVK